MYRTNLFFFKIKTDFIKINNWNRIINSMKILEIN